MIYTKLLHHVILMKNRREQKNKNNEKEKKAAKPKQASGIEKCALGAKCSLPPSSSTEKRTCFEWVLVPRFARLSLELSPANMDGNEMKYSLALSMLHVVIRDLFVSIVVSNSSNCMLDDSQCTAICIRNDIRDGIRVSLSFQCVSLLPGISLHPKSTILFRIFGQPLHPSPSHNSFLSFFLLVLYFSNKTLHFAHRKSLFRINHLRKLCFGSCQSEKERESLQPIKLF